MNKISVGLFCALCMSSIVRAEEHSGGLNPRIFDRSAEVPSEVETACLNSSAVIEAVQVLSKLPKATERFIQGDLLYPGKNEIVRATIYRVSPGVTNYLIRGETKDKKYQSELLIIDHLGQLSYKLYRRNSSGGAFELIPSP
jgi:hypothetical protein